MGKKKRQHPDAEELLNRPWCYYCERDFDDLKILISHQKAKHFKCERCGRRLNTAGGLYVHMNRVHRENLTVVENALPNRTNPEIEIFGMEGIPEDVVTAHNQRVLSQFQQAEAERRAATGNPGPGDSAAGGPKKPKLESPEDLKKRLAEHKAKIAEQAAGGSSGGATPHKSHDNNVYSQNLNQNSGGHQAPSPAFSQPQQSFGLQANANAYSPYSQPYDMPGTTYQHHPTGFSPQVPHQPVPHQPPSDFQNPNVPYPPLQQFHTPQPYHGAHGPTFPPHYPGGIRPYGSTPSPSPFMQNHQPSPRALSPQNAAPFHQPGNIPPAAPGLPPRPSFAGPPHPVALHQPGPSGPRMHPGGPPLPLADRLPAPPPTAAWQANLIMSRPSAHQGPIQASDLPASKNLTTTAAASGQEAAAARPAQAAPDPETVKPKTEKDKAPRLVYSDNEVSPEEKMARLAKYAFNPAIKTEDAEGASVAGVAGISA